MDSIGFISFLLFQLLCSSSFQEEADQEFGEDYIISGDDYSDDGGDYNDDTSPEEAEGSYSGYGQPQMAFLLQMNGCSSVLIHRDWLLSASHCFQDYLWTKHMDDNKDLVFDAFPMVSSSSGALNKTSWNEPLSIPVKSKGGMRDIWRVAEKVYTLDFKGENRIFEGNDLVLVKLAPESETETLMYYTPACLPDPDKEDFKEDLSDKLFFTGFGRRRIPHCVTDTAGPEEFNLCGRPTDCSHDHKTDTCGVEFIYKDKVRTSCLTLDTPSADNPTCKQILEKSGQDDFKRKTFVINADGGLETTCYPFKIKDGAKGWCATRPPWSDENQEPKYDSGWGFCGEDIMQSQCNESIDDITDTKLQPITRLQNEYCVQQLKHNLDAELPGTPEEEYNNLDKMGVVCIGQNTTHTAKDFDACKLDKDGSCKIVQLDGKLLSNLQTENKIVLNSIDGGVCFGDSGGPLLKYIGDKPVLVGIMSFLLWGTCRSQYEPSFYTRIHSHMDFILKHIPKDELCLA